MIPSSAPPEHRVWTVCEHVFVRWENLTVESETEGRLPGYRDPTVVRTFDAPEALDIRFHEVRARSALNHVPGAQFGFAWTVNVYRGCSHACTYCLHGDTPILMADGRTKRLEDVRVGDGVYGTVREGSYRRYVTTEVSAHWPTVKPAFRVRLEDGTELIASSDHRFLSDRGWKHVSDSAPVQRAHLTTNNKLMGTGAFAAAPQDSDHYRRGYLCGLIRGDGQIGSYSYSGRGRRDVHHRFRLALTDIEALRRARRYLTEVEIATREFDFPVAIAAARPMTAIRTSTRSGVDAVREIVRWPQVAGDDWRKGFLAGIFDAEGSHGRGILHIANTDPEIIDRTTSCLARFGFPFVVEDLRRSNSMKVVRLTGGLRERLRFFLTTDPAITRKRTIDGMAIKGKARLRVASIEPLGVDLPMFDITTGTGDFIANGVISHNCFARRTHRYLDFDAGRDFEREIVVKVNAPEILRAELARPSWKRDLVALGTNTDPYQWVESRYRLTRGVLEALRDHHTPVSVLTKSPLALRDRDLFEQMREHAGVSVNLSVPTLDEKVWRETEPHTPSPRTRLDAVAKLNRAGIPSGVMVAPLMPGINDSPEQVEPILRLAREAKATFIGHAALHLRDEVRDVFFGWLEAKRPDLVPRYEQLYSKGAYMPATERGRLAKLVGGGRRRRGRRRAAPAASSRERQRGGPPSRGGRDRTSRQESLF